VQESVVVLENLLTCDDRGGACCYRGEECPWMVSLLGGGGGAEAVNRRNGDLFCEKLVITQSTTERAIPYCQEKSMR